MSISGRHRSPLLREIPDLPKNFYSFQSAAQPGGALFCSSPFEVIYQLYPTANVFCAIDILVYKTAISSPFSHVVCNIMPSISQQQKTNRHGDRCHGGSLLHFFFEHPSSGCTFSIPGQVPPVKGIFCIAVICFLYGSHFRVGGRAAVLIFLIEVRAGALVQIKA